MKFSTKSTFFLFLLIALVSTTTFCQPTADFLTSNPLAIRQSTVDFHTWTNLWNHGQWCFFWCNKVKGKGNDKKKPSSSTATSAADIINKRDDPFSNIGQGVYRDLLRRFWSLLATPTHSTWEDLKAEPKFLKRDAVAEAHDREEHPTTKTTTTSVGLSLPASITNPYSTVASDSSLLWDNSSTTAIASSTSTGSNITSNGGFTPTPTASSPGGTAGPSSSNGEKTLWDTLTIIGGLIFWAGGWLIM